MTFLHTRHAHKHTHMLCTAHAHTCLLLPPHLGVESHRMTLLSTGGGGLWGHCQTSHLKCPPAVCGVPSSFSTAVPTPAATRPGDQSHPGRYAAPPHCDLHCPGARTVGVLKYKCWTHFSPSGIVCLIPFLVCSWLQNRNTMQFILHIDLGAFNLAERTR